MTQQVRKFVARLSPQERANLQQMARSQSLSALQLKRVQILLLTDANDPEGQRTDEQIAQRVDLTVRQVKRIRRKFVEQGLEATLHRQKRSDTGIPQKVDGEVEAQLVTLCCSTPPQGHQRWTLQLLVDEMCRLQIVPNICRETVRKTLKKIASNPGNLDDFASRNETVPVSLLTWNEC